MTYTYILSIQLSAGSTFGRSIWTQCASYRELITMQQLLSPMTCNSHLNIFIMSRCMWIL